MLDGDYETLLNDYTEDVIIMPDFVPALHGVDEVRRQQIADQKKGVKYHSFSGIVEKRWQHGNEIYEMSTFGMAVSSHKSKRPQAFYGPYFLIWRKGVAVAFKITFTIWNLDLNPFE